MVKKAIMVVVLLMVLVLGNYAQTGEAPTSYPDNLNLGRVSPSVLAFKPTPGSATSRLSLFHPYTGQNETPSFSRSEWEYPEDPYPYRLGTAIAEVVGVNVFVWGFGQYVMDNEGGAHSYINLDTMRDNLTYWFEWDPNHFATNFFAHPYHGSLYFNAGRSNGLDFWASGFTAFMGSFMWEMVMEHHRPSVNDLIMTTTGGMFLGEALFRFSNLVLDDSKTGWSRTWREVVGALLNPLGGLNRLVHGDMFRTRSYHNQIKAPLFLTLYWSGSLTNDNVSTDGAKASPGLEALFVYGEAFKDAASRKPLDYFPLQIIARRTNGQLYFSIYANGILAGKEPRGKEGQQHLFGLFQHYDYIYNENIRLGGTSFCPGLISAFQLSPHARLTTSAYFGWMMLGASTNEYVGSGAGSSAAGIDYNYGTGYTAKVDLALQLQKYGSFIIRWAHYKLFTLEGVDGTDRLNLFQGRYVLPVWKGLGLGLKFTQYRRNSQYDKFPDVKQKLYAFESLIAWRF
jgi:hypothetical protein